MFYDGFSSPRCIHVCSYFRFLVPLFLLSFGAGEKGYSPFSGNLEVLVIISWPDIRNRRIFGDLGET